MKKVYAVMLTQDTEDILIEVPDFAILTQAKTLADAIEMARDAIGLNGITLQDAWEEIPTPTDITAIDITRGTFYEEGKTVVTLVDIDFDVYRRKNDNRMVRRNVTLPNWMNVAAEKAGLNVSKVLQEALREKLQTTE